jgi:hypothetical protein
MTFIADNTELVLVALAAALGLLAVFSIYSYAEFKKARRMYRAFMVGVDKQNLEQGLLSLVERLVRLEEDRDIILRELREAERRQVFATQRVGMIRFNAFHDAGGELSFALALLDGENNGIVMSSIYGRAEARIYAKPVEQGKSSHALSKEEEQAIAKAQRKSS